MSFFNVAEWDKSPFPKEEIIILSKLQSAPRQACPMNFAYSNRQLFEKMVFLSKVAEIKRFTRRI